MLLTSCPVVGLIGQHVVEEASLAFSRFPRVIEGGRILRVVLSVGAFLGLELVGGLELALPRSHFPSRAPSKKLLLAAPKRRLAAIMGVLAIRVVAFR